MKNTFVKLANDLISFTSEEGGYSFVFKTKIHAIIVFLIYGHEKITFEEICSKTTAVVSRTTIQSILIDGVKLGYLNKIPDKKDNRKKYYTCAILKPILEKWHNHQQKLFS